MNRKGWANTILGIALGLALATGLGYFLQPDMAETLAVITLSAIGLAVLAAFFMMPEKAK